MRSLPERDSASIALQLFFHELLFSNKVQVTANIGERDHRGLPSRKNINKSLVISDRFLG